MHSGLRKGQTSLLKSERFKILSNLKEHVKVMQCDAAIKEGNPMVIKLK